MYTGQFVHDIFEGNGSLKCTAFTYTGSFRHGKFHGTGEYRNADGAQYVGTWSNGVLEQSVLQTVADASETQQDTDESA
jgi:hypothetical protein